jgi:hypothetical protein
MVEWSGLGQKIVENLSKKWSKWSKLGRKWSKRGGRK